MKHNHVKQQKAVVALCFTALSFVILGIVARMMGEGFGPITQTYLRIGCAFVLAVIIFHKKLNFSKIKHIPKKDWLLLLIMGTFGYGIAVIFATMSVLETTLMNASIISSTIPFFAMLYVFLLTKKAVKPILFLFLIISFIGVYFITAKSFSPVLTGFGIGEFYALLFAAGSGAFIVSRGYLSDKLTSLEVTVIVIFIAFLSSLITALLMGERLELSGFSTPIALLGLILGTVLNVLTTYLQNYAFNIIPPVAGSQLLLLQNIFAPVLGFMIYNEIMLPIEFLGAALILVGVIGYYKKAEN